VEENDTKFTPSFGAPQHLVVRDKGKHEKYDKLEFSGLFVGCCGAAAPSAPPLGELAKIFDF
jgi:hypothetical protein